MTHTRLCGVVFSGLTLSACAQVATFTPLSDLLGGGTSGGAAAISADGLLVAGSSQGADGREATRWTLVRSGRTFQVLAVEGCGFLFEGFTFSTGTCIADDGSVYGSSTYATDAFGQPVAQAFRWHPDSGIVGLGFPPGSQSLPQSFAMGCSADGSVLCGYGNNTTPTLSIMWRDGAWSFVDSGGMPRPFGMLRAISRDGAVAVGYEREGANNLSFTLSLDRRPVVQMFPGQGKGVSPNGAWACGSKGTPPKMGAVLLEIGRAEEVIGNPAPGEWAVATTVADHGRVATVRTGSDGAAQDPWYWDRYSGEFVLLKDKLRVEFGLDLAGWDLTQVAAMDADGRAMAGEGINPQGEPQAFHVTLPYACPGDHNRDGRFDTADVVAFLNDWTRTLPRADADNDGAIDTRDVAFFLERWVAGC